MRILWIAAVVIAAAACNEQAPVPAAPAPEASLDLGENPVPETPALSPTAAATEMPIARVESLMVSRLNDNDETVLILVAGSVDSVGWTDAHLEPVDESQDSGTTRSFEFLATSPAQPSAGTAPQTIEARLEINDLPPEVEVVRVVAATNELSAFVGN